MSFPFVVRELDPAPGPDDHLIVPVPRADIRDAVHPEPLDGDEVTTLHATGFSLHSGDELIVRMSDIRLTVTITGSRVTLACSKFDKGGGWFGGFTAIALNAGSKALAANRRRGKMLVGQLRYPWLSAVYAQNKSGWASDETLRLVYKQDGDVYRLNLILPKQIDAVAVAEEIIRRAASFRLAHEPEVTDEERQWLTEFAGLSQLEAPSDPDSMAGKSFPTSWPVGNRSARFGAGDAPAPHAPAPRPAPAAGPPAPADGQRHEAEGPLLHAARRMHEALERGEHGEIIEARTAIAEQQRPESLPADWWFWLNAAPALALAREGLPEDPRFEPWAELSEAAFLELPATDSRVAAMHEIRLSSAPAVTIRAR